MLCVRYVPLAIIIGSKCATLRAFVQSTYVTEMIDLYGLHEMHVNFGLEVILNFNQSALCSTLLGTVVTSVNADFDSTLTECGLETGMPVRRHPRDHAFREIEHPQPQAVP